MPSAPPNAPAPEASEQDASANQAPAVRMTIFAPEDSLDAIAAALFEEGAGALEEKSNALIVYASDSAQQTRFSRAAEQALVLACAGGANLRIECEPLDNSWQETWQKALRAEQVTPHCVLRPVHCAPAPKGENTLWFRPEQAFGSGGHPTTQLLAGYLEENLHPQDSVFDVGTGSGVLSMIAVRCGAERVLAVDNDPISVSAAAVNVALNAMQDRIVVREGSAEIAPERFDWVVANINTPILHELLHQLVSAARPGGRIVLSGLLEEDAPGLIRSACSLGVELVCERRNAEWALLCFKHEPFKRGSGRRK